MGQYRDKALVEKLLISFSKLLDKYFFLNCIPVLMYHRVNDLPKFIDPEIKTKHFRKQIELLKARDYYFVSLEEVIKWTKNEIQLPKKSIALTFDDGYQDNYLNVLPIIKQYDVKVTIFLIADFIGKKRFYSENRRFPQKIFEEDFNPKTDRIVQYLSVDQIKDMHHTGLVDFGSHTSTHPDLRSLYVDFLEDEIAGSKRILEDQLNFPIKTFSYPYGRFNETIMKIVKKAGYIGAVTTIKDKIRKDHNPFELSRWIDNNLFVNMPPVIRKMGKLL